MRVKLLYVIGTLLKTKVKLSIFIIVKHPSQLCVVVYSPVLLLLAGDVLEVEPVQALLGLYHTHVQAVPPE